MQLKLKDSVKRNRNGEYIQLGELLGGIKLKEVRERFTVDYAENVTVDMVITGDVMVSVVPSLEAEMRIVEFLSEKLGYDIKSLDEKVIRDYIDDTTIEVYYSYEGMDVPLWFFVRAIGNLPVAEATAKGVITFLPRP